MRDVARRGKVRVLVMDDDAVVRSVFKRMLERLGYEVELATDGDQAVALYRAALQRRQPFDVVILDQRVPGGRGGEQALTSLRELDPRVHAILVTGYPEDGIADNFADTGFADVIIKPVALNEMREVLAGVIARSRRAGR